MEKINVAELLKDYPKGMELDCTICNNRVTLEGVVGNGSTYPIRVISKDGFHHMLTCNGGVYDSEDSKCVIFPKGKTTWEGFKRPFKDGDIVYTIMDSIAILNNRIREHSEGFYAYCGLFNHGFDFDVIVSPKRLATEEEKEKLFKAIKDNGYKWNAENKTLEKLIQPNFKVGDKIKHKTHIRQGDVVTEIKDTHYILNDELALPFIFQDEYELVPNKFCINTLKPFDKVLVRDFDNTPWEIEFFSRLLDGKHFKCFDLSYVQCIPYEGNEHLNGKTDDCDDFYKTWK